MLHARATMYFREQKIIIDNLLTSWVIPQWLELLGHVLANRVHCIFVDERHCVSHVHTLTIDKSQNEIKERII